MIFFLVISLGSVEERDDWILKMKSLIENLKLSYNSIQSIIVDEPVMPVEAKSTRAASSTHTGLTCLGVTIVKESKKFQNYKKISQFCFQTQNQNQTPY